MLHCHPSCFSWILYQKDTVIRYVSRLVTPTKTYTNRTAEASRLQHDPPTLFWFVTCWNFYNYKVAFLFIQSLAQKAVRWVLSEKTRQCICAETMPQSIYNKYKHTALYTVPPNSPYGGMQIFFLPDFFRRKICHLPSNIPKIFFPRSIAFREGHLYKMLCGVTIQWHMECLHSTPVPNAQGILWKTLVAKRSKSNSLYMVNTMITAIIK